MTEIRIPDQKRIGFLLGWEATEAAKTNRRANFIERAVHRLQQSTAIGEKLFGEYQDAACDLDVCCYGFDADNACIDIVRPGVSRDINESESVYHTGDESTGRAGEFDEELFVDLAKLPDKIRSLVLYVRVANVFEVEAEASARLRIMNATDSVALRDIAIPFDTDNEKGFVAGILSRNAEGWFWRDVKTYAFEDPDDNETEFFAAALRG